MRQSSVESANEQSPTFPHEDPGIGSRGYDLRRMRACWHACAGISTTALENGIIGELLDAATNHPAVVSGLMRALENDKLPASVEVLNKL
jgi:hypothetical protein